MKKKTISQLMSELGKIGGRANFEKYGSKEMSRRGKLGLESRYRKSNKKLSTGKKKKPLQS